MHDVGVPDDGVERAAVAGEAVFLMHLNPGVDEHRFGIHEQAVEIKNERVQHKR